MQLVPLRPGDRVLSLCCGTGLDAAAAAEAVGEGGLVVGVDVSEGMLAVAWTRLTRDGGSDEGQPRIHLFCHDVSNLHGDMAWSGGNGGPVAAGQIVVPDGFDAVICSNALFQFRDPGAAVRHWRRYLRAGGLLAVDIPHEENMPAGLAMEQTARRLGVQYVSDRAWIRSKESVRWVIEAEGFSMEETAEFDKVPGRRITTLAVDQADGQFNYIIGASPLDPIFTEDFKAKARPIFREEFAKLAAAGGGQVNIVESVHAYVFRKLSD